MMLKAFFAVRKMLVYSKVWMQRTMSWIAVANAGMILFLVLSQLEQYGIDIRITIWFIPIYVGVVLLMILLGYLEDRAGMHREEIRRTGSRNPHLQEIIQRLDRIENELKRRK